MTGPVLILGAMEGEVRYLVQQMGEVEICLWKGFSFFKGTLYGVSSVIARCGVGKVLSAMVTQKGIDLFQPQMIVFTGIAGALDLSLEIGDIVLGAETVQHDVDASRFGFPKGQLPYTDYRFIPADPRLLQIAEGYQTTDFQIKSGRILTGDQFISDSGGLAQWEGSCVDMEGASVALTAHVNEIPHLIIRVISDRADGGGVTSFKSFLRRSSKKSSLLIRHIINTIDSTGKELL